MKQKGILILVIVCVILSVCGYFWFHEEAPTRLYGAVPYIDAAPTYDAIVFQDATKTYAVAKNGTTLSSVLISAHTDDIPIQAAIDSVGAGGTVFAAYGTYTISTMITVKPNVKLEFSHSAIVTPQTDIDMFYLSAGGRITGCKLLVNNIVNYASNCIILDGHEHYHATLDHGAAVEDVWFYGAHFTGTAIDIRSNEESGGYVWGILVNNIRIHRFDYGIKIYRSGAYGANWINGNTFTNIHGYTTRRLIWMNSSTDRGDDTDGNVFDGINLQSGGTPSPSVPPVLIAGRYNEISHCKIWDWNPTWGNQFEFAVNSSENHATLTTATHTTTVNHGTSKNTVFLTRTGEFIGNYTFAEWA